MTPVTMASASARGTDARRVAARGFMVVGARTEPCSSEPNASSHQHEPTTDVRNVRLRTAPGSTGSTQVGNLRIDNVGTAFTQGEMS